VAHNRQAIRDAVVSALTGLTTTDASVFAGRVYQHQESELPLLRIYTRQELVEYEDEQSPRDIKRILTVEVRGIASATGTAESILDTIALEIEDAMDVSNNLGGLVADLQLKDADINADGSGDQAFGDVVLRYEATYYTVEKASAVPVDDFITFHADSQLDADPEPELVTEETLPQ